MGGDSTREGAHQRRSRSALALDGMCMHMRARVRACVYVHACVLACVYVHV